MDSFKMFTNFEDFMAHLNGGQPKRTGGDITQDMLPDIDSAMALTLAKASAAGANNGIAEISSMAPELEEGEKYASRKELDEFHARLLQLKYGVETRATMSEKWLLLREVLREEERRAEFEAKRAKREGEKTVDDAPSSLLVKALISRLQQEDYPATATAVEAAYVATEAVNARRLAEAKAEPQALLGLATTREMLEEIAVRGEVPQTEWDDSVKAGAANMGEQARRILASLPRTALDYRTVESDSQAMPVPLTIRETLEFLEKAFGDINYRMSLGMVKDLRDALPTDVLGRSLVQTGEAKTDAGPEA